ncbi:hypothetical protein L3Y34_018121 [Caenorhabditis briggsae]|uniref:MIF4G domain-containing protein n=1 Tax=Caenorhabditis briggsae TaxID=6238 RepID=A0AAE9DJY0_CAEBR|nr:hypothetical protein L3Y34_018121 [Caenorhabditis briggsae]
MSRSPSPDSPPAVRDDEEKDAREQSDSPTSNTDDPKSPSESPKSNRSQESSRKDSRESGKRRDSHEDEKMPLTPPNRSSEASPQHRRHRESRSPSRSRSRSHRSHSRSQYRRSRSRSRDRRSRSRSRDRRSHSRSRDRRSPARRRSPVRAKSPAQAVKPTEEPEKKKNDPKDLLRTRTGGAYIPPAKLRLMQQQITDKSSEQYQRMNWERMKKKIHGLVNRVNAKNLVQIVRELLQENVIRSKGLLCRDIIQAQAFSPGFSNVYAALAAVINSKFPHIGELLLRRLIVQFKRSFRRNDRGVTVNVIKFIAHLINQQVAHEVLALEIMILMLEEPTDDSVEVAIAFLKECGAKLMEIAPAALNSVYDRLRAILMETERSENALDRRIQYMIETAMQIRKDKFAVSKRQINNLL